MCNQVGLALSFHSDPTAWGQERLNPKDVAISYLPLAHIMERQSQANLIAHGASVGYYRGNPLLLIEDVAVLRPTLFAGPPRLYNRLYDAIVSAILNEDAATAGEAMRTHVNVVRTALRDYIEGLEFNAFNSLAGVPADLQVKNAIIRPSGV